MRHLACAIFSAFIGRVLARDLFSELGVTDVYYINLDHRTDRNAEFTTELLAYGVSNKTIHRRSAVRNADHPEVGCSDSHIEKSLYTASGECV